MKNLLFVVMLCSPLFGYACFVPPQEQYVPVDELISRTEKIVLATVTEAKLSKDGWGVIYKFRTDKTLKGSLGEEFEVIGSPPYHGALTDFDDHREHGFWNDGGGRETNGTDCEISPSFGVGLVYLVFVDKPYHRKSFELITKTYGDASARDKWLQYVEGKTSR